MLFNKVQIEVPRRVAAHYLLFCLTAIGLFFAGVVFALQKFQDSRTEVACLAILRRSVTTIGRDYLKFGESSIQSAVERARSEGSLAYCAIVATDGRIIAHSSPENIGQMYKGPRGEQIQPNGVTRARFVDVYSRALREYRGPLKIGNRDLCEVHVAIREPGLWRNISTGALHIPVAMIAVSGVIGLGAIVLYRMVRPFAEIDRQLCAVARSSSIQSIELRPVSVHGGAALGWNRLVDARQQQTCRSNLAERVSTAVDRRGQKQAEDILNSLMDGIAVTDVEGRITFANQAMTACLGGVDESVRICGRQMSDCLGSEADKSSTLALFDPQLQERTVTAELTRQDGADQRICRVARYPLRSGDQKSSAGHVWTIRDVTQQKLAEKARDQFLDTATHELRTPLANIKAYAETLSLSDMLDVEQQKEFCNTINSEATRLARFIDDLLSVSSMEVGSLTMDYQEVDTERLLREATQKVQPQIEQKDIRFDTVLPAKLPTIKVDKDKFTVVLVNLLGNAAKYTPNGGRIAMTVRAIDDQLFIEIQDSGVGIAEEELPRIFDKFFRSSDPRVVEQTGTGLGLSFADEVVRKHRGSINVTSEIDKGSTFTVVIPIA